MYMKNLIKHILACFSAFSSGCDEEENDNRYTYVDPPGMYNNRLNLFANFIDQIQTLKLYAFPQNVIRNYLLSAMKQ